MTENLLQEPAPNIDYFAELVGENKKFKTPQDLAKGKYESDQYIKTLELQKDELRADYLKLDADYKSRTKLEELIDQLETRQKTTSNQPPLVREVKEPVIDPKQIETVVSTKLQEIETQRKSQENVNLVGKTLKEHFGENYQSAVKKQLETLDLTEDDFNNLARTRPNFLLKALGVGQQVAKETFQAPPRNERRSDNFAPQGAKKRTWSYYQNMKKENPSLYRDPKTNVEMHNDMIALGNEFKDGDFALYGD